MPSRSRTEAFGRAPPSDDPGARSRRKSSSVSVSLKSMLGGREQSRQFDQRRYLRRTVLRQKRPAFPFAQNAARPCALRRPPSAGSRFRASVRGVCPSRFGAPAFGAAHQHPPPAIRSGIADGAEKRLVGWRVKWAGPELQGWLKREALRMREPALVVFESGAFPVLRVRIHSRPTKCGVPAGPHRRELLVPLRGSCFSWCAATSRREAGFAPAGVPLQAHARRRRAGGRPHRPAGRPFPSAKSTVA